jgi:hypothetical protein
MRYSANEILEILDQGANTYDFPMLDNNYFYLGKERMTVFRNNNEWLIIFQELSFSLKANKFTNVVAAFGNCIKESGIISLEPVINESSDDKMFDDNYKFLLNPLDFKVAIKGVERKFKPTRRDYEELGINIDDKEMPNEAKIIRYLAYTIPKELFFTNEKLLKICKRKAEDIKVFMELDDWYHPDLINDELPSENLCFQSIAVALEKNALDLYNCPEEEYNTHWFNWEWYKEDS